MPIPHQKYPTADSSQHNGQGIYSEPTPNKKPLSLYDQAALEYRAVLMSKGTNYDPSGNRGSNPCPKDLLLPEDAGRDRCLRPRQVFPDSSVDAGGPASELHDDSTPSAWTASRGNQHNNRGLSYPAVVYLAAIGIAILVSGVSYFLPVLIGAICHLGRIWWVIGGVAAVLVAGVVLFSLLRISAVSDEIGGR